MLKALGAASLRKGLLDCYKCPECEGLSEDDLVLGSDAGLRCFHCEGVFQRDAFKRDKKEVTFAVCGGCLKEFPLTPASEGFVGYLCTCDNYVAIPFEDEIFQPQEIMSLQWNAGIHARGIRVAERCVAVKCETDQDWLVLTMMQVTAKGSNGEFKFGHQGENDALLAFDPVCRVYIGYLLWYEKNKKYATLNQLFVMPEQRRKGHAEKMVKHWVADHAKRIGEQFALESPNDRAIALHMKLGHIRKEGDTFIGINGCCFAGGF